MNIPDFHEISNAFYLTDGGTILLEVVDSAGIKHEVKLSPKVVSHMGIHNHPPKLYFDNQIVDIFSDEATKIANFLHALLENTYTLKPSTSKSERIIEHKPLILSNDLVDYFEDLITDRNLTFKNLAQKLIDHIQNSKTTNFRQEHDTSSVNAVLYIITTGKTPVALMKVLRENLDISMAQAKQIITQSNIAVVQGTRKHLLNLGKKLENVGAIVKIIDDEVKKALPIYEENTDKTAHLD